MTLSRKAICIALNACMPLKYFLNVCASTRDGHVTTCNHCTMLFASYISDSVKHVHINYVETEAPLRHPTVHLHYRMWLISKMPPTQAFLPSAISGLAVLMFKPSQ